MEDDEEVLLRSVAMQNAQSILLARQRAEQELLAAKEALELRTAELERANGLIRTIAENAASSLLMLDERGYVSYMNPASVALTGFTLTDLADLPLHDILHAPRERGGDAIASCPLRLGSGPVVAIKDHRDVFLRRDGSAFPVSCSLAPLYRNGALSGAVLEFRNITDELLAQKTLEDANRRKDEFLATLSHELRTPMTSILGWVHLFRIGLTETEKREAISAIERSANIQAQLIDQVLDVSRIAAGKMLFVPTPVDVSFALQNAISTIYPAAAEKEISIASRIPRGLPAVSGDASRLQQVFWNLLSNSIKFSPRGGLITAAASRTGSRLQIAITDSGKGISADYLPHVFETFSQEDSSSTRAYQGIGLGLSIARSLVELHGGTIRAASDGLGKGATFTVELPAAGA